MSRPKRHSHHTFAAFGTDRFGRIAERFARLFGTPQFIVGQTILVVLWIAANGLLIALRWDPYPFILLNLAFSTQAAYAAPLILLAQTRQADRDKVRSESEANHREEIAALHSQLLRENTVLTAEVHRLAAEVHKATEQQSATLSLLELAVTHLDDLGE